jgi:hypothetical protein
MSWTRQIVCASLALLCGCASGQAAAVEVCPSRGGQSLRYVDVFDGTPAELATLVPDRAGERSGYWQLGYVYNAGRFVTIRCKYSDGSAIDVKLAEKVDRCDYRIDARKTLALLCK